MLRMMLQYFSHLMRRADPLEKTNAGKDLRQEEKGPIKKDNWLDDITDTMDMSLHQLWEMVKDREAWQCCSPWDRKELDMTERLNNNKIL